MTIMPMNRPPAWEVETSPFKPKKRGLFGSMGMQQPAMTAEPMQMAAPRKPGFFGEGGTGRAIAGNIGDALLQFSGMQPIYQPAMADQRAMQFRAQQDAQRQQQDRANFIFEQDYKRANPAPVNNDTVADYNFWQSVLSPEEFQKWRQNKIDPPQYRQGADGRFYRIDVAPPGPAPTITEDEWSKGTPVNGGQSATPTGGFRR